MTFGVCVCVFLLPSIFFFFIFNRPCHIKGKYTVRSSQNFLLCNILTQARIDQSEYYGLWAG
jgi:hypothetical protein